MNRAIYTLVATQFLSAFGDNAILFTIVATVLHNDRLGAWYVPALQSVFIVAFVSLTPWVGAFADRFSKPRVLTLANLVKAAGGFSILMGVEPLIGYGIVGIGAATYSPAKYGILPELTKAENLVKANSWIEGATIVAILFGTVTGARLADASVKSALIAVIGLYFISATTALCLPPLPARGTARGPAWRRLLGLIRRLTSAKGARPIFLALSLFWATAATLRIVLVAWAPAVLHTRTATDIAELTLYLALGIIVGSGLVPRLIPLEQTHRTRFAAYALGSFFFVLAKIDDLWAARGILFVIGVAGGIFVVPLNALIQQIGHGTVGSGGAVAVQNFFQNGAILVSTGLYTLAAAQGVGPVATILALGTMLGVMAVLASLRLPKQPAL
jgi:LPLT family lysophospholipid transporter-like MFS transporter